MSDDNDDIKDDDITPSDDNQDQTTDGGHAPAWDDEAVRHSRLHGMYRTWFLDYASYVILERAVPHLEDGLKPVQRRILHTMSRMEDGRYNKVANIVGAAMQFHPHGDASIADALVQLGQKELLIDTQGNWGNILTGDPAAASRYIEARLTKFALDVLYNPKTTQWMLSYDGRNEEPVTLPAKFPLLLAQGAEGIAVGLSSKILPHNFNELIDASISYLRDEPYVLYPDFPTGGSIDVSKYNDGRRGGSVRVRAKITKKDIRTLAITEIPFGRTTSALIESILKANDKKLRIKHIDDNTAAEAEILITLPPGTSPDKTIDALYAFTDCELSITPNACVIIDKTPRFLGVSDILRLNTDHTVDLLRRELEIRRDELELQWHMLSLEKIFIEERIYKAPEFEQAGSTDEACEYIDLRLTPYYPHLRRAVTKDDILHLLEIKMARILRFNSDAAEEKLVAITEEIHQVEHDIEHIIDYTIEYFRRIKRLYGKGRVRRTEIRSFDNIEAAKVVVKNLKLYINREDGFMGYGLKKGDFVGECSDIDDAIIFYTDGRFVVRKIEEKTDIGTGVLHIAVFHRNDRRTIYNVVYADGRNGISYAKRFYVSGITHDKEYNFTTGTPRTRVLYFSANPDGEGELLKVLLKPKLKMRNVVIEYDMAQLAVKGRDTKGNILTRNEVHKIVLKRKGDSTLGGRQVWFEPETLRLNADGRGRLLGEFQPQDKLLIIRPDGTAETTGYNFEQHFNGNELRIVKYDPGHLWTVIYLDTHNNAYYLKRFRIAPSSRPQTIADASAGLVIKHLSDEDHPRFRVTFAGPDAWHTPEEIIADDFIAEKGITAKGKRLTTYQVRRIDELTPLIPTRHNDDIAPADDKPDDNKPDTTPDDPQKSLF